MLAVVTYLNHQDVFEQVGWDGNSGSAEAMPRPNSGLSAHKQRQLLRQTSTANTRSTSRRFVTRTQSTTSHCAAPVFTPVSGAREADSPLKRRRIRLLSVMNLQATLKPLGSDNLLSRTYEHFIHSNMLRLADNVLHSPGDI